MLLRPSPFPNESCPELSPGPKTKKKNTNSTPNKYQTRPARAYKVASFLSTDCELSTETCSRFLYSLGPRRSSTDNKISLMPQLRLSCLLFHCLPFYSNTSLDMLLCLETWPNYNSLLFFILLTTLIRCLFCMF